MLSDTALWTGTLERLMFSLFAAGALLVSWDLLKRAVLPIRQTGPSPKPGTSIGPRSTLLAATLFGLFGAAVLAVLLVSNVNSPKGSTALPRERGRAQTQLLSQAAARRLASAINTVQQINLERLQREYTTGELAALRRATEELDSFRTEMVRQIVGERDWELYLSNLNTYQTIPESVSPEAAKVLIAVDSWMAGSYLPKPRKPDSQ